MMHMSVGACCAAIRDGKAFHAAVGDEAFFVKIEDYTHFVCTAIHSGHRMRPALREKCALSEAERLYEEDPFTDEVIADMPITVIGNDSRFEYDLNRAAEACIYEEAWGKTVWRIPLSEAEKAASVAKHEAFYTVLGTLYDKLEGLHPAVLVYDVHAYNYRRPGMSDDAPMFNVGTEQLDTRRWQQFIGQWVDRLGRIRLPGVEVRAAIDETFYGRGYHATFIGQHCRNTLALPTELKKVFMDETSGEPRRDVLQALRQAFTAAVLDHAQGLARDRSP